VSVNKAVNNTIKLYAGNRKLFQQFIEKNVLIVQIDTLTLMQTRT